MKPRKINLPVFETTKEIFNDESGRIGYIIAWLLGVPSSLLLLIFLIRGH